MDTLIQGLRLPLVTKSTADAAEVYGSFQTLSQWYQGAGSMLLDLHMGRNNLPVLPDNVLIEQDDLVESKCKSAYEQLVAFEGLWLVDEESKKSWNREKKERRQKAIQSLREYQ